MKELWRDLVEEAVVGLADTSVDQIIKVVTDLARSLQSQAPGPGKV
ncbi:hypothetical protein [Nonomuraea sp. NPDC050691]